MGKPNWANRTIWTGDNLDIMRGMNSESVDLIYADPPFNSNRNYAAPIGSQAAGAAFKDTWTLSDLDVAWMGLIADTEPALYRVVETAGLAHGKGMQSYLCMMAVRLLEMKRLLRPAGSIYLHCDPTASHYLKTLMDVVFGRQNFRNEIIWAYTGASNTKRWFPRKHDVVLFYVNDQSAPFDRDAVRVPYSESFMKRRRHSDASKWEGGGDRPESRTMAEVLDKYKAGKVVEDWWSDIPILIGKERVGYPTQKPLSLLARILKASSVENGIVLDPFCGCATACVAAEKLNRGWVGIDLSEKAAELVVRRVREAQGLFQDIKHRDDVPQRSDTLRVMHTYREMKHILFGEQEGVCNLCNFAFEYRILEVDHVWPKSKGGPDHIENRQLLCPACNKIKGTGTMEEAVAKYNETYANSAFMNVSNGRASSR